MANVKSTTTPDNALRFFSSLLMENFTYQGSGHALNPRLIEVYRFVWPSGLREAQIATMWISVSESFHKPILRLTWAATT